MEKDESILDTIKTIIYAILIAIVIRTFLFEPFKIPSGSMYPTLHVGDYLFVSKYTYGYSKHSFPFSLPLFNGRIWADTPQRGDVVVFKFPQDNKTDFIKRIIGLPGDKIKMQDGILYINGKNVDRQQIEDFVIRDKFGNGERYTQYVETLPNGVKHNILEISDQQELVDNMVEVTVPENSYFVMGDNRDRSDDSRLSVGFVPFENLVGKARWLFFSHNTDDAWYKPWAWTKKIRFERMFKKIQ
ncbi:MAG: signal peptidase I [Alphaproteobacteria bacterium]|nr:signal peptidase I [Alphaproteobacteria bacterium]MBQ8631930.1 signal peptidase I [Alphaproteobacteria bacterium]